MGFSTSKPSARAALWSSRSALISVIGEEERVAMGRVHQLTKPGRSILRDIRLDCGAAIEEVCRHLPSVSDDVFRDWTANYPNWRSTLFG